MRKLRVLLLAALVILALASSLPAARADYIFNVSVDTSNLSRDMNLTGPFGLDFQILQGDGSVVNTATIGNIVLGGGTAVGSPSLTNSSGSLASTISLNDSSFFSDFNQQFRPGTTLSFQVDLTTNVGTTTPDEFSFSILQNYGTSKVGEIPTTDPSGANTLITGTINASTPSIVAYAGSDGTPTPPLVAPATAVPEPDTLVLSLLALGSLAAGAAGNAVPGSQPSSRAPIRSPHRQHDRERAGGAWTHGWF